MVELCFLTLWMPPLLPPDPSALGFWLGWGGLCALLLGLGWVIKVAWRRHIRTELLGDVPPQIVAVAQKYYQPVLRPGTQEDLVHWLLHKVLTKENTTYQYYLLLGPDGVGKTTLLARFFAAYSLPWRRKPWRIELFSLGSPDAMLRVSKMPRREEVLLILDGLEDDPAFADNPRKRLDEVLVATQGFARVVLSCDADLWPGGQPILAGGEALRYVGEETAQLLGYLPMPTLKGKDFANVKRGAETWQGLRRLAWPSRERAPEALPSQRLARWLASEGRSAVPLLPEAAPRPFWWKLAEAMQMRARQGLGLTVPAFVIEELGGRFAPDWDKKALAAHLLWQDRVGRIRFVHGSLLAFFRAEALMQEQRIPDASSWRALPRGGYYFQSMAWTRVLRQGDREGWSYRTPSQVERRPLATLRDRDLLRVSRLYVPATAVQGSYAFLPQLRQLRGVYFEGLTRHQVPANWLAALPHNQVYLYLIHRGRVGQVLSFQNHQAQLTPSLQAPQEVKVDTLSLEPVVLRKQPLPTEPLYNPRGHHRGDASLIHLLHVDFKRLMKQMGFQTHHLGWVLDERLSQPEWGLFNQLRAYRLKDHTLNLVLEQTAPSTLLAHELRQLLPVLMAALGPDDEHWGAFQPDDEAQLEDGHWRGRRWLWGASDRYAHPVHLFVDRPGCATMIIWGLQTPRSQKQEPKSAAN